MFGIYFSSSGIFSVVEESFIVNRSVLTIPSRRSVNTPSAGVNGDMTSSSAVSPGAKSFLLDIALRRRLSARNPDGHLAFVKAFLVIHHGRGDRITTALLGNEGTLLR